MCKVCPHVRGVADGAEDNRTRTGTRATPQVKQVDVWVYSAMEFSRTRGRHARTYGHIDTDSSSNERDAASIYICQCQPTLKTLAQCDSTNSKLAIATREIEKTLGGQRSIPVSGWSDRKPRRRRHRMGQLSRRALLCPARVSTVLLAVETRTHFLSITC
jgi:hypothetical protein